MTYDPVFEAELVSALQSAGMNIAPLFAKKMSRHAFELQKWNRKINLTAVTKTREMIEKHYIDSLVHLDLIPKGARVLDIGSGGGFPGLPVKICRPDLDMTMMDASLKKVNFLKHVIRTLNLEQAQAVHARAEQFLEENIEMTQFDIVMSRAFSSLESFIDKGLPYLSVSGYLLAFKSRKGTEEIEKLPQKAVSTRVYSYTLPFSGAKRSVIEISPLR